MFLALSNDQSFSSLHEKNCFTISITSAPFNIDWLISKGEQL